MKKSTMQHIVSVNDASDFLDASRKSYSIGNSFKNQK